MLSSPTAVFSAEAHSKPMVFHIPAGPEARTHVQYDKALSKYHLRTITETYEKFGSHSTKWDGPVRKYIKEYSAALTNDRGCVSDGKLYEDARIVVGLGCDDPMVELFAGNSYCNLNYMKEGLPLLEKSLNAFEHSRYPKAEALTLAKRLVIMHSDNPVLISDELSKKALKLYIKWMGDCLDDGGFKPGDDRIAIDLVLTGMRYQLTGHWKEVLKSTEGKGRAIPYAAKVIVGDAYMGVGWDARGNDFAYKVPPEGWKGLESNMRIAEKKLTDAWRSHPDFPEAPAYMIEVSMGLKGDKRDGLQTWFNRAVAVQMDFMPAYDAIERALLPWWFGSPQELYDFGALCLKTKRFDTCVPEQFLSMINRATSALVYEEDDNYDKWLRLPASVKYMDALCDGYTAADPSNAAKWQSRKAAAAWYRGDYSVAQKLFRALGDKLDGDTFHSYSDTDPEVARSESFALGGSAAEQIKQAKALVASGSYADSIAIYEAILHNPRTESEAVPYVKRKLAGTRMASLLTAGKYVDIRSSDDLTGWRSLPQNRWKVSGDGEVNGKIEGDTPVDNLVLQTDCPVGFRWQITGDAEANSASGRNPRAGVCWNFNNVSIKGVVCVLFQASKGKIIISDFDQIAKTIDCPSLKPVNHFDVRMWDGELRIAVNGVLLPDGFKVDLNPKWNTASVGLGGEDFNEACSARFSNVRLRLLADKSQLEAAPAN